MPRVVGGATRGVHATRPPRSSARIAGRVHRVSSPEAAELTKLYENSFRAVNIAFANEIADASRRFGLDPVEVIEAAGDEAVRLHGVLSGRRRRRALHPL